MRRYVALGLLLCLGLLVQMSHRITVPRVVAQRATLPPTWTSTFTYTPLPTATITLTPSPTATLTQSEICQSFHTDDGYSNGFSFPHDGTFAFITGASVPSTAMRLLFVHRLSDELIGTQTVTQPLMILQFPIDSLPRHGLYDWTLTLIDQDDTVLCERDGYFFVRLPAAP